MNLDFEWLLLLAVAVLGMAKVAAWRRVGIPGMSFLADMFPLILVVFLIRAFVVEPFRIPSDSMLPTLESGDFILVNKFLYGLRLPVSGLKLLNVESPERGDVFVFRYPQEPSIHYIKRIVGLPGDTVSYEDNQLAINGVKVPETVVASAFDSAFLHRFHEQLGAGSHDIYVDPDGRQSYRPIWAFDHLHNCSYRVGAVSCRVPEGYYFGMGDNRDNSADSRYWGFVPAANIEGKAFLVWLNVLKPGRIGLIH